MMKNTLQQYLWILTALLLPSFASGIELKQTTLDAFAQYSREAEARIEKRVKNPSGFLWLEESPDRKAQARRGEVVIGYEGDSAMKKIPDGLIHHWIGGTFIAGVTLSEIVALVQDYDNHERYYAPEVVDARLLNRNGNDFKIYYRLRKKKVITVILNTEHDVRYFPLDDHRLHSRSYTTKIAEVKDPGEPTEHEAAPGEGHGFLWRLNSYWRFEERDGGVYVELEAISLTRGIPFGVGWIVKPVVRDLPLESLTATLENTRAALAK